MVAQPIFPKDHVSWYKGPHKDMIWSDLRCVLAAPIIHQSEKRVIGVISFDSSKTLNEIGFDSDAGKTLAQMVAGVISEIISPVVPKYVPAKRK